MSVIQITIQRTSKAGTKEVAKTYNTAFEGELSELVALQVEVDRAISEIIDKRAS